MTDKKVEQAFTDRERAALHSLAEMFSEKEDRDTLRELVKAGVTIKDLVFAYKYQKTSWRLAKWVASFIAALGAAAAVYAQITGKGG